ncbi:MAG: prepilin-type N-terminal cleavage/methylation domain-containing protein [Puniceicoccaceae bacterium]|nr:prepilin-type N-terminal cleavage/methylation domain-containing protein [Puniceicoccaceae bacterium]MBL6912608.1 prepilin-type N-terminal cleavage/methylation domain-containing protein [Puniceicoccaceae bacterium]
MLYHTPVVAPRRGRIGFTLIEMIGVLAIIAILAAVITPAVIKSIRESKITSTVGFIHSARVATTNFFQRYEHIPLDKDITTVYNYKFDPGGNPPSSYTPAVGSVDFGDILVYQSQFLEMERSPIGRNTDSLSHAVCSHRVGDTLIGGVVYTGSVDGMHFESAGAAVRIVYYFIPNLTTQEASGIAIQINGPFGKDALSDLDFIEATLAGQGISSIGGLEGADVWFTSGDNPGEYHAYAYVFHL